MTRPAINTAVAVTILLAALSATSHAQKLTLDTASLPESGDVSPQLRGPLVEATLFALKRDDMVSDDAAEQWAHSARLAYASHNFQHQRVVVAVALVWAQDTGIDNPLAKHFLRKKATTVPSTLVVEAYMQVLHEQGLGGRGYDDPATLTKLLD